MNTPTRIGLVTLALCGAVACRSTPAEGGGGDISPTGTPTSSLVVDANRDGQLDITGTSDDEGKASFDAKKGAVFLANLDDDNGDQVVDSDSASVDGDDDVADLTPIALRAWAGGNSTTGTVKLDDKSNGRVRLFRVNGDATKADSYAAVDGGTIELSSDDIKSGALFAIEAIDVVTSKTVWDGKTTVSLEVKDKNGKVLVTDKVQLRVAPVIFQFNTANTQQAFWTNLGGENQALVDGVHTAAGDAITTQALNAPYNHSDPNDGPDPWAQDFFDIAFMSRPGPNGQPIGMKVAVRSAQPDRSAGGIVWSHFLGKDFGAIELSDPKGPSGDGDGYSMNSFGNWDVIPPYTKGNESYPLGRNIWGAGKIAAEQPDKVFSAFVRAQDVQPPVNVDTSWLVVGHVDEIFSWVKNPSSPRGWTMLAGSPKRAKEMLQALKDQGNGASKLFVGKQVWDYNADENDPPLVSAAVSVTDVLNDADRLATSQAAQVAIDAALDIVKTEVGLADNEIVEMPFLFETIYDRSIAYQPGTVNLLHMDGHVVVPKPFGPKIGGVDPFEADARQKLEGLGLNVTFADDWDVYHANMGEVHCGTNVSRDMTFKWWESGR